MTTLANLLFASTSRSASWSAMDDLLSYYAASGGGWPFLQTTWSRSPEEKIPADFAGIVESIYKRNGVVAACMFVRLSIFSQARFAFRKRVAGRPAEIVAGDLSLLERPWGNARTPELLSRVINDADLVGNSFTARRPKTSGGYRLKRMRPDWSTIAIGVDADPEDVADPEVDIWEDLDAELIGYGYHPGGHYAGQKAVPLLPEDVAHFAPKPDPTASYRGISWLTALLREVAADNQATNHKSAFFRNAASPNLVVSLDISDVESFIDFVDAFNDQHKGVANAYKTLFFGAGADVKPVGHSFREMDYKRTMAIGETRIASAAGLSAVIARISEGLQGSALNAGNYTAARRMDADTTFRDLWGKACTAFDHLVAAPDGAELWYDAADIPFLQEDAKDAAEILKLNAQTITALIYQAGFKPDAAVAAVESGQLATLAGEHTGKLSVQLQNMDQLPDIEEDEGDS